VLLVKLLVNSVRQALLLVLLAIQIVHNQSTIKLTASQQLIVLLGTILISQMALAMPVLQFASNAPL